MLEHLLRADRFAAAAFEATLLGALKRASSAIARLDQALDNHPLVTAFLYRARLEAVRRQAAVDGLFHPPRFWGCSSACKSL
jgi:hypothetical protein